MPRLQDSHGLEVVGHFFMVGIIEHKLKVDSIEFGSTHGSPTQGTIYTKEGFRLHFRFRGSQFKVVIESVPRDYEYRVLFESNILSQDNIICMHYYWRRTNMNFRQIKRATRNILEWK